MNKSFPKYTITKLDDRKIKIVLVPTNILITYDDSNITLSYYYNTELGLSAALNNISKFLRYE